MKAASDKTVGYKSKKLRRDIARVLTELRAREIAAEAKAARKKKSAETLAAVRK